MLEGLICQDSHVAGNVRLLLPFLHLFAQEIFYGFTLGLADLVNKVEEIRFFLSVRNRFGFLLYLRQIVKFEDRRDEKWILNKLEPHKNGGADALLRNRNVAKVGHPPHVSKDDKGKLGRLQNQEKNFASLDLVQVVISRLGLRETKVVDLNEDQETNIEAQDEAIDCSRHLVDEKLVVLIPSIDEHEDSQIGERSSDHEGKELVLEPSLIHHVGDGLFTHVYVQIGDHHVHDSNDLHAVVNHKNGG